MNDTEAPPLVFANHVLKQLVAHLLGEDMIVEYDDYMALRTVFRWCGGNWALLGEGDIVQLNLLAKIVSAWGQMPERTREGDRLI